MSTLECVLVVAKSKHSLKSTIEELNASMTSIRAIKQALVTKTDDIQAFFEVEQKRAIKFKSLCDQLELHLCAAKKKIRRNKRQKI
jgi:hypothetical protein